MELKAESKSLFKPVPKVQRVLFAGGGSGGHILPAVAVAGEIAAQRPDSEILFVTSGKSLDRSILQAYPFYQVALDAPKLPSKLGGWPQFTVAFVRALADAFGILRQFRPEVVVGTGAYASVPTVLVARLMGIRIVLLEPNLAPGRATRWLARFAHTVVCSHTNTATALRPRPVQVLGTPVRREIEAASRTDAYSHFNLDPHHKTLLILGGSQGSSGVNRIVTEAMPNIFSNGLAMNIIHQTGEADFNSVVAQYRSLTLQARVMPFIEKIDLALAAADVVVSRAGAITIAEMTARNVPSILIPLPHSVEGDQLKNAKHMQQCGAAMLVEEGSDSARVLAEALQEIVKNPEVAQSITHSLDRIGHPDARTAIARLIVDSPNNSQE